MDDDEPYDAEREWEKRQCERRVVAAAAAAGAGAAGAAGVLAIGTDTGTGTGTGTGSSTALVGASSSSSTATTTITAATTTAATARTVRDELAIRKAAGWWVCSIAAEAAPSTPHYSLSVSFVCMHRNPPAAPACEACGSRRGAGGYGRRTAGRVRALRLEWGGPDALAKPVDENKVSEAEEREMDVFARKARRLKKLRRELDTGMAEDHAARADHDEMEAELKSAEKRRRDAARRDAEFARLGRRERLMLVKAKVESTPAPWLLRHREVKHEIRAAHAAHAAATTHAGATVAVDTGTGTGAPALAPTVGGDT
jgi:hypothetical protein